MDVQNMTEHDPGWYPLQGLFDSVPYHSHLIIGSLMVVILFFAVGGNALVITVFMGSRKMRTPSNTLVLNLAVADLLMALLGFPFLIVSSFYGHWVYKQWVCDYYGTVVTAFGLMSINTLVFISLDRYIVIVGPQRIPSVTSRNVRYYILAIWVYSFAWGILPLLGWNRYILVGYGTTCSVDYFTRDEPHNQFLLCMMIFAFIIPCCIITTMYVLIFRTAKQLGNRFKPMSSNKERLKHGSSKRSSVLMYTSPLDQQTRDNRRLKWTRREYKIGRTMLIVVLMYLMAWMPYAVVTVIGQYGDVTLVTPTVSMLSGVFAKGSTVYNPFIYALTHPGSKQQLSKMLKKIFPACFQSKENSHRFSEWNGLALRTRSLSGSSTATRKTSVASMTVNKSGTIEVIAELNEVHNGDRIVKKTLTPIKETTEQSSENNNDLNDNPMTKHHKERSQI